MEPAADALLELLALVNGKEAPKAPLSDPGRNEIGHFAKATEPETQRDAAIYLYPESGTQRLKVLDAIERAGGLADEQGEDVTGMLHQSYTARRRELVTGGWVVDSGRRRENRSGTGAVVWVLSDAAKKMRTEEP